MSNINFEKKMRLKANRYSYNKAFARLKTAIEKNNNDEVYASIGELLLWVATTEQWHFEYNDKYKRNKNCDKNGLIMYGIRHAYNMMKHNMNFFTIFHKEGGVSFPIKFPIEIKEIEFRWMVAGNTLKGDCERQRENYIKYIEGEEIISTFEKAITFLNKVNKPFLLT